MAMRGLLQTLGLLRLGYYKGAFSSHLVALVAAGKTFFSRCNYIQRKEFAAFPVLVRLGAENSNRLGGF